jgi:membrane-bound ClpP family serine protease
VPTLVRYLLMQVPGWVALVTALIVLRHWVEVPTRAIVGIAFAWMLKDVLLYRIVKPAYTVDRRSEMEKLVGSLAEVRYALTPTGYVQMNGALWRAEAASGEPLPIPEGCTVKVRSTVGLTLVVSREPVRAS